MTDTIKASTTVYLASFAALLGALSMGLALGYTAPAFISMGNDTTSPIYDTDTSKMDANKSLVGSVLAIGALIGGVLGEPCNKLFGRRLSLILFGIPFVIGWLFMALASGITMLIFGRALTGLCCGLVSGTAPTYVVEISPPSIRGLLGTCFQVMVVIGILLAAVFGTILSWQALAGVSVFAAVGMSALMVAMPETPQWLLSKQRADEAESALARLRTSEINTEYQAMKTTAQEASQSSGYSSNLLMSREFMIPLMFALALMFFQQFSGINAVLFYQSDIFENATPNMNVAFGVILVCVAQVIATIIGSVLVDYTGRRILLLASGVGHTVSLIAFGLYSHMPKEDQPPYAWVALVSLVVFISSFSIGYGPIPWMMIPELSSARVRSLIASIGTAFNWTCVYIVTAFVKTLIVKVGDDWTYWIFAIVCASSCAFVVVFLPETKGKSSEQIQAEVIGTQAGAGAAIPPSESTQLTESSKMLKPVV